MGRIKMMTVVGARPQFVKAAVVSRYLREHPGEHGIDQVVVHTGQHYDAIMSDVFFEQLQMEAPAYNLGVGSGTVGRQLADMFDKLEPVMMDERPDVVLVYGDTNSTLAAGLMAVHHDIPLVHVEAGERIYRRWAVPEEVNRVITDTIASLNLTSTQRAGAYLRREGMASSRVRFVGDTMYELFLTAREQLGGQASVGPESYGVERGGYHLATIHRAENTNDQGVLLELLGALDAAELPVLLPVHPRVGKLIKDYGYEPGGALRLIEPLGYFDFMNLLVQAAKVVTDSGGVTREAFFAQKPGIVPMDNSWWTEVVESGWAVCVGKDGRALTEALNTFEPTNAYPEGLFGDGQSGKAIVEAVEAFMAGDTSAVAWHRHGGFDELPQVEATSFTYDTYRGMMGRFREAGYGFAGFGEAEERLAKGEAFVLLRHDIDVDLEKALRLARLENEMGIAATYFFMVRNDFYNVFSGRGSAVVNEILGLGHRLGVHFDCAAYGEQASEEAWAGLCGRECAMLEQWFGRQVEAVSYHRPDAMVMEGSAALSAPLKHTYMPMFVEQMTYCSDSTGRWRYGSPFEQEGFEKRGAIHLLVHPIWWGERAMSNYATLGHFIDERMLAMEAELARNNTVYRVGCWKGVQAPLLTPRS